jgi:hypothetical protein
MFGPAISTVFASRWRALWFCASILLLAYCSVPAADDPAGAGDGAANTKAARDAIAAADLNPEERAQLNATLESLEKLSR